jgi:hypothetical protein
MLASSIFSFVIGKSCDASDPWSLKTRPTHEEIADAPGVTKAVLESGEDALRAPSKRR